MERNRYHGCRTAIRAGFFGKPRWKPCADGRDGQPSTQYPCAHLGPIYTLDALEVLTQLSAAHFFSLCQALDLRAINERYLEAVKQPFIDLFHEFFHLAITEQPHLDQLSEVLCMDFNREYGETAGMDSLSRFSFVIQSLQARILQKAPNSLGLLHSLKAWADKSSNDLKDSFDFDRKKYLLGPDAGPYLGIASRRIYKFVRNRLDIPSLQEANVSTPGVDLIEASVKIGHTEQSRRMSSPWIGSYISTIYESMRSMVRFRNPVLGGFSDKD